MSASAEPAPAPPKPVKPPNAVVAALPLAVQNGSTFYDEVEIEDFDFDEAQQTFFYPCPCGDKFRITMVHDSNYFGSVRLQGENSVGSIFPSSPPRDSLVLCHPGLCDPLILCINTKFFRLYLFVNILSWSWMLSVKVLQ